MSENDIQGGDLVCVLKAVNVYVNLLLKPKPNKGFSLLNAFEALANVNICQVGRRLKGLASKYKVIKYGLMFQTCKGRTFTISLHFCTVEIFTITLF